MDCLSNTKVEQFASQAYQLEVSDMVRIAADNQRQTLLLCLLHQMQVRTRDQLATMFLRRIQLLHNSGKKRLKNLKEQYQSLSENMVDAFAEIVDMTELMQADESDEQDLILGKKVREVLEKNGGAKQLKQTCQMLQAFHDNNYLPLLPHFYRGYRSLPFRLTAQLQLKQVAPQPKLFEALDFIHSGEYFKPCAESVKNCQSNLIVSHNA